MITTTLKASTILSASQWQRMELQEIEDYIRQDLARQLVDTILNEDLIQIYTDRDLSTDTVIAQTQFKIIQE